MKIKSSNLAFEVPKTVATEEGRGGGDFGFHRTVATGGGEGIFRFHRTSYRGRGRDFSISQECSYREGIHINLPNQNFMFPYILV